MKDILLEIVITLGGPPAAWKLWLVSLTPQNNDFKVLSVMVALSSVIFAYLLVRRILSALTKPTRRDLWLRSLERSAGLPHLRNSRHGKRCR